MEREKTTIADTFKRRVMEHDKDMKEKQEEFSEVFDAKIQLEKEKKVLIQEREKMKEQIRKLRARKGKFDIAQKTCKNCARDYIETENYNWSCRVHMGEWSGEIWWCCGKDNKDQPGCKYSKHESKEDDDDEDDILFERPLPNIRCMSCKETGHTIELCPRDPNLRSTADTAEDFARIQ